MGPALALSLMGCLPKYAENQRSEAPGESYRLRLAPTAAESVLAAPFETTVELHHARTFKDSSSGWLVCLGALPAATTGGCVEMRAFATGEVVVLRGTERYLGPAGGIELVAALWPVLSPRLSTGEGSITSWPLFRVGRESLRTVATGPWVRQGATWSWEAYLTVSTGTPVTGQGRYTATLYRPGGRPHTSSFTMDQLVCFTEQDCRRLAVAGELTAAEPVPRRPHSVCPAADPSRAPLCLADGTVIDDEPTPPQPAGLLRRATAVP